MLIVIPTYKRNHCLKWVLQSLVQCKTDNIQERIRVVVVNNYPQAREEIQSIVSKFSHEDRFEWDILFRERTLPPVESWYSAITDNALPDEVVLLHGDDDIFCPWSLEERYKATNNSEADLLLSRSASRLIFLPDGESAIFAGGPLPRKNKQARANEIDLANMPSGGGVFIGNNCYRNTEKWRKALAVSLDWCHSQDWLDWNTRTLMLPYYLPFAVNLVGGKLCFLDQECVIRGGNLADITRSLYGVGGWNSGFLALCAYGVLTSPPLKNISELSFARDEQKKMAAYWRLAMYVDPRISSKMRRKTFSRIQIPLTRESLLLTVKGVRLLFGQVFRFRGWRYRLDSLKSVLPLHEFLQSLLLITDA